MVAGGLQVPSDRSLLSVISELFFRCSESSSAPRIARRTVIGRSSVVLCSFVLLTAKWCFLAAGGSAPSRDGSEGRDAHGGMQFTPSGAGPSMSMDSGSMGSPSQGNEDAMVVPVPNGTRGRVQHPESMDDDPESPGVVG